jgi:hypothetical protein
MPWTDINMDAPQNGAEDSNQGGGSGNVLEGSKYPNDLWVEEYHKGRAMPIYIKADATGGTYLKYPGTLSESLGRSSTIPLHRVEENFDIGDHISIDSRTFSAKLTLVRVLDMQKELESMLDAKELVDVKCSLGEFKNMGIVALDFRETGFQNTLECDIKFLEVRVGSVKLSNSPTPRGHSESGGGGGPTNIKNSPEPRNIPNFH